MATTQEYIDSLKRDKKNIIDSLNKVGMELTDDATFTDIANETSIYVPTEDLEQELNEQDTIIENINEILETRAITDLQELTKDANASVNDILSGKTAYVNGAKIEGGMSNNGTLNYTPSTEMQIIPEGYTEGGIVNAVHDDNLLPENIKKDVVIFDVTGTLEGGTEESVLIPFLYKGYSSNALSQYFFNQYYIQSNIVMYSICSARSTATSNGLGELLYKETITADDGTKQDIYIYKRKYTGGALSDYQVRFSASSSGRIFLYSFFYDESIKEEEIKTLIRYNTGDTKKIEYEIHDIKKGDLIICNTITAGSNPVFAMNTKNTEYGKDAGEVPRITVFRAREDAENVIIKRANNEAVNNISITLLRLKY